MPLALYRWTPGRQSPRVDWCHSPAQAMAEAWLGGRRDVAVIAVPGEVPRRPTPWEARVGRAFCTYAARVLYARSLAPQPLPDDLDSDYGLIQRRPGRAPGDPFRWVLEDDPAPAPVPAEESVEAAAPADVPPRRRVQRPAATPAEMPVYRALIASGGPVHERQADLGRNWASKRERAVRSGSATVYLGYGTWLLLGRDIPLTPRQAEGLSDAGRSLLEGGPMFVSDVLARLAEAGPPASALDSPVLMAALLRRRRDVAVDDRTGVASLVAAGTANRIAGSRPRMFALPPPVPSHDGGSPR